MRIASDRIDCMPGPVATALPSAASEYLVSGKPRASSQCDHGTRVCSLAQPGDTLSPLGARELPLRGNNLGTRCVHPGGCGPSCRFQLPFLWAPGTKAGAQGSSASDPSSKRPQAAPDLRYLGMECVCWGGGQGLLCVPLVLASALPPGPFSCLSFLPHLGPL